MNKVEKRGDRRGSLRASYDDYEALQTFFEITGGGGWLQRWNTASRNPNPKEWCGLTFEEGHVATIDLHHNHVRGELDDCLTHLKFLKSLDLSDNEISGCIPESFCELPNLETLRMQNNKLAGSIPVRLWSLSSLRNINFMGNAIQLSLSDFAAMETVIPFTEHRALNALVRGVLQRKSAQGELLPLSTADEARQLGVGLTVTRGHLTALTLHRNELEGHICDELRDLIELEDLNMENNRLEGSLPEALAQLRKLRKLSLKRNRLRGVVPQAVWELRRLEEVDLQGNALTGCSVPDWEVDVLMEFFNATGGDAWARKGGWGKRPGVDGTEDPGIDPVCWRGVRAQRGHVSALVLPDNMLTGELPSWMSNLKKLTTIDFSGNRLQGDLPFWICEAVRLKTLVMSYNVFTGAIPATIGSLTKMTVLKLASNQLTGAIPESIAALAALEQLDLSENELTGPMPDPSAWVAMRVLRLNHNALSGAIPSTVGLMTQLRVLNISNNKLSGEIPTELGDLPLLHELSLLNNEFTGDIPEALKKHDEHHTRSFHIQEGNHGLKDAATWVAFPAAAINNRSQLEAALLIGGVFLFYVDVLSDVTAALAYRTAGHYDWFYSAVAFVVGPAMLASFNFYRADGGGLRMALLALVQLHLPLLAFQSFKDGQEKDLLNVSKLNEAVFEAAPQLLLQTYSLFILTAANNAAAEAEAEGEGEGEAVSVDTNGIIFSISLSVLALAKTCTLAFDRQRVRQSLERRGLRKKGGRLRARRGTRMGGASRRRSSNVGVSRDDVAAALTVGMPAVQPAAAAAPEPAVAPAPEPVLNIEPDGGGGSGPTPEVGISNYSYAGEEDGLEDGEGGGGTAEELAEARRVLELWDETNACFYYYHTETDESMWEAPASGYTKSDGRLQLARGAVMVNPDAEGGGAPAGGAESVTIVPSGSVPNTGSAAVAPETCDLSSPSPPDLVVCVVPDASDGADATDPPVAAGAEVPPTQHGTAETSVTAEASAATERLSIAKISKQSFNKSSSTHKKYAANVVVAAKQFRVNYSALAPSFFLHVCEVLSRGLVLVAIATMIRGRTMMLGAGLLLLRMPIAGLDYREAHGVWPPVWKGALKALAGLLIDSVNSSGAKTHVLTFAQTTVENVIMMAMQVPLGDESPLSSSDLRAVTIAVAVLWFGRLILEVYTALEKYPDFFYETVEIPVTPGGGGGGVPGRVTVDMPSESQQQWSSGGGSPAPGMMVTPIEQKRSLRIVGRLSPKTSARGLAKKVSSNTVVVASKNEG